MYTNGTNRKNLRLDKKNSRMKTKLTKFRNLLFQLMPEEPTDPTENQ